MWVEGKNERKEEEELNDVSRSQHTRRRSEVLDFRRICLEIKLLGIEEGDMRRREFFFRSKFEGFGKKGE